tara:strand:- start:853 stop:1746 length:894 start_codon:yes stop_codon:yes gene_type:complete
LSKLSIPISNFLTGIFGIGLSIISLYILEINYKILDQLFNVQQINYIAIGLFIFFYTIALILKPVRFYYHLDKPTYRDYRSGFYIGNFFNNILPFRLGDLLRIFFFTDFKKSKAIFLIVLEKILDLFSLVILLSLIIFLSMGLRHTYLLTYFISILIFFSFFITFVFELKLTPNVLEKSSFTSNVKVLIITLSAWTFEGLSYASFFYIFEDLDFWKGFSFMPIAALSSIIPSAPGYIGVINYAMTSWSSFLDLFESSYAYYSFLIVFLMWFTTCIMGVLFLIKSPKLVANFFKSLYK